MKLQFSHITKTAGTSLENTAFMTDIRWGQKNKVLWSEIASHSRCTHKEPWHVPLSLVNDDYLERLLTQLSFFTIVRNPYERCISEYYCKWGSRYFFKKQKIISADISIFNQHLAKGLKKILQLFKIPGASDNLTHWQQQHRYIFKNKQQIISSDNIFRYENLDSQIQNFYEQKPFPLKQINRVTSPKICNKIFSVKDLSKENVNLINEIYYEDFILLDYKLL